MKKAEAIEHWNDTPKDQNVLKYFTPLESNAKGSTYGACGIRICGNSKFIDAVMSRLKDVVDAENAVTRLLCSHTRYQFLRSQADCGYQPAAPELLLYDLVGAETCRWHRHKNPAQLARKC